MLAPDAERREKNTVAEEESILFSFSAIKV